MFSGMGCLIRLVLKPYDPVVWSPGPFWGNFFSLFFQTAISQLFEEIPHQYFLWINFKYWVNQKSPKVYFKSLLHPPFWHLDLGGFFTVTPTYTSGSAGYPFFFFNFATLGQGKNVWKDQQNFVHWVRFYSRLKITTGKRCNFLGAIFFIFRFKKKNKKTLGYFLGYTKQVL